MAAVIVWCRGSPRAGRAGRRLAGSSRRRRSSARLQRRTCPAASSTASGSPSRRAQSSTICVVRRRPTATRGSSRRARSTNSSAAAAPSGSTGTRCSSPSPSGSRLVARMRQVPPQAERGVDQLGGRHRSRARSCPARSASNGRRGGRRARRWIGRRRLRRRAHRPVALSTSPPVRAGTRSTNTAPSGQRSTSWWPTARATLVLPTPPGPISVMSRAWLELRRDHVDQVGPADELRAQRREPTVRAARAVGVAMARRAPSRAARSRRAPAGCSPRACAAATRRASPPSAPRRTAARRSRRSSAAAARARAPPPPAPSASPASRGSPRRKSAKPVVSTETNPWSRTDARARSQAHAGASRRRHRSHDHDGAPTTTKE